MVKSRFIAKDAKGKVIHRARIVEPDFDQHDAHVDDAIRFATALGAISFEVISE